MGWLIAIIFLPILFMLIAAYVVLRLTILLLRIVFIPLMLMTRR
jgi:hypothetical protein